MLCARYVQDMCRRYVQVEVCTEAYVQNIMCRICAVEYVQKSMLKIDKVVVCTNYVQLICSGCYVQVQCTGDMCKQYVQVVCASCLCAVLIFPVDM